MSTQRELDHENKVNIINLNHKNRVEMSKINMNMFKTKQDTQRKNIEFLWSLKFKFLIQQDKLHTKRIEKIAKLKK